MAKQEPQDPVNPDEVLATVYGPVGYFIQKPGENPKLQLLRRWSHVEELVNGRIEIGSALTGGGRYPVTFDGEITDRHIEVLSEVLEIQSHGVLSAIRYHKATGG